MVARQRHQVSAERIAPQRLFNRLFCAALPVNSYKIVFDPLPCHELVCRILTQLCYLNALQKNAFLSQLQLFVSKFAKYHPGLCCQSKIILSGPHHFRNISAYNLGLVDFGDLKILTGRDLKYREKACLLANDKVIRGFAERQRIDRPCCLGLPNHFESRSVHSNHLFALEAKVQHASSR